MNRNVIILGIVILAVSFGALSAGAAENLQPRDEVVFHNHYGVSNVAKVAQHFYQTVGVARMKTNAWFV